ncbi:MAG: hypothetical protein IAE77_23155 [Prosthecobacter sp.]|uniref:hypothetical protein n=1 Tax=Prosthecobacter sp. TaxID=1965333 RepID=UPI0019DC5262|nr:hypothetical protein [Prosthecobacter sp.]MBE2286373.1 hypothetical protein [Prosthecobacter sp.]
MILIALGTASALMLAGLREPGTQEIATPRPPATPSAPSLAEESRLYTPLRFEDLFVTPAGPRGLSYTTTCQGLAGKAVRMEGHMVRHYHEDTTVFLFTAVPSAHNQAEYLLADSLPTSLVHVIMNVRPGDSPAWRPQRITVMGRLELGPRQEADGRVSHVRLLCDHVADARTLEVVELRKPLALQRDRMVMGPPNSFRPASRTITAQASQTTTTP